MRIRKQQYLGGATLWLAASFVLNVSADQPERRPASELAAQCTALASADFSAIVDAPSQVTAAKVVEAAANLPAYCQVSGYVTPSVGFELRLPGNWNGKFMQVGCGGHCGELWATACDLGLGKGYACLVSDMGHKGTGGDGAWAYNNLQAKVDWGYRATHVVTVAGKAITEHFYARRPGKSYFMGCSTGGRQGLQEAQRFPWDFDGIIAGAPPINLSTLYMELAWGNRATHDGAGKALLGAKELKLLTSAAVARCDSDDGVKDEIIGDPVHCRFDPAELVCKSGQTEQCLNTPQLEAVKRVYAGPLDSRGAPLALSGPVYGSEEGSWSWFVGTDGQPHPIEGLITNGFRYLFFWPEPGPSWQLRDFNFDVDYKRMGLMQALVDSSNPDLRRFKGAGGKLLVYQGLNDSILPRATMDYYETVERTMGGRKATQDFFRLFMLPGVLHCAGGPGADAVDFLSYLEAWVERGQAPDRILSGHLSDASPATYPYRQFSADSAKLTFTRPVYPYPVRAKYKGSGDPNDAANFVPEGKVPR